MERPGRGGRREFRLFSTHFHGYPLVLMDLHGFLWISTDFAGFHYSNSFATNLLTFIQHAGIVKLRTWRRFSIELGR